MQEERIRRLRSLMQEQGLRALLITNATNRLYMTGFTGSSGYVVVTEDRAILLTDFRYMTQAPQQAVGYEVIEHAPQAMESVKDLLAQSGLTKLGFEQNDMTYGVYQACAGTLSGIELVPTDSLVEQLRMVKDDGELAIMQEAAELADRTFEYVLGLLKPGMRELDIALEIEMYVRAHGAASTSFETIVASGERSALPHGKASDKIIGTNEFVKLDFGAYYKGYCSDITRTVVLGTPTDKHREIYSIVLEAQLEALDRIRPGMTGREADAVARDVIKRYGYGDLFGHGTGHGLGMEIHEAPRLSMTGEVVLAPGMTVTVEPGIYVPGFGGVRIEDDIVITDNGNRRLTQSSKDLIVIP
ncbi:MULTISPECIES: Xaa-Pro peptidase family protein [unclassified Paenibacillus]|uniref:M24 family metallopeptidase n=1 Tax=unclassified Paenibacillus TaxID=185978 RepID=UPI001AE9E845|nr:MULTISPECIES: Xaa-Pro peptidase family protein [unclassified Paenibacillus]MBP1155065.1 Xaa-Pro aminopeptidase [Paenibacillus sp. PvP091]MBP1169552.1 Xaa-Pro aminopeptidase [Paenibacillus sp. PvR098]MBP2440580.1 Xaa-Pro aminopeptidase [Paenibacillus sp. PvP052]